MFGNLCYLSEICTNVLTASPNYAGKLPDADGPESEVTCEPNSDTVEGEPAVTAGLSGRGKLIPS